MTISKTPLVNYIIRRVALFPLVIFSVVTINFLLIHLSPGGPFSVLLSNPTISPHDVKLLEAQYGLNKPLYEQYFIYIYQILRGNFGISYFYGVPVIKVILTYLPNTLELAGFSIILSSFLGISLGTIAAMRRKFTDKALNVVGMVSYTTPVFFVGIIMILVFSVYLKILPPTGVYVSSGFNPIEYVRHIIMPVISLSIFLFPPVYFFARSNIIQTMGMDYIKALRSKGIKEKLIFYRHALHNALLPVVTLIGLQSTILFGGAVIVEVVFTWPGIGFMTYTAILQKDYPLLLGSIFFFALLVAALNLLVDIVYIKIDPRVVLK